MTSAKNGVNDFLAFMLSIIAFIIFFVSIFSGGSSGEIFYDDSSELKAQDDWAKEQLYQQEREARWQEQQDEHEGYLEWVRAGRS